MIRKFENLDLDTVMQIWLQANLDAHAFIPASFWEAHFEIVRDMLPQAELYVHENEAPRQIDSFIGLTENHIEGIFVAESARSKGVGKALLEYAKSCKPCLTLSVYQKTSGHLRFTGVSNSLCSRKASTRIRTKRRFRCTGRGRRRKGIDGGRQPSSVLSICVAPQIVS